MDEPARSEIIRLAENEISTMIAKDLAQFIEQGKKGHCPMADSSDTAVAELKRLVARDAERHAAAVYKNAMRILDAAKTTIQRRTQCN